MPRISMLVTAAMLSAASAFAQTASPPAAQVAGSPAMHAAMERMQRDMSAMAMTGDADRDWVMMMRRHHQGAIDVSRAHHDAGRDREIERMARKLIEEQTREIAQLDEWLRAHPAR